MAFAYPSVAPLADGKIGIALEYGGGRRYPSTAVGVLRGGNSDQSASWDLISGLVGANAPCQRSDAASCGAWGDYLTVRPFPDSLTSAAVSWGTVGFAALNPYKPSSDEQLKMGLSLIRYYSKGN